MNSTKPSTISVIIIDPIARTITRTEIANDYDGLRAAVFPSGDLGYLDHMHLGAGHGIYIDEEGILKRWDTQGFFRLGPTQIFAGRGVLVRSTDDGDSATCQIPIAEVKRILSWIEPQDVSIPAPTMVTIENGIQKVEYLAGVERWDYNNQPN